MWSIWTAGSHSWIGSWSPTVLFSVARWWWSWGELAQRRNSMPLVGKKFSYNFLYGLATPCSGASTLTLMQIIRPILQYTRARMLWERPREVRSLITPSCWAGAEACESFLKEVVMIWYTKLSWCTLNRRRMGPYGIAWSHVLCTSNSLLLAQKWDLKCEETRSVEARLSKALYPNRNAWTLPWHTGELVKDFKQRSNIKCSF